jgi:hypothetical protein
VNRETPAERAAFRAFVKANHPDRGGDPDIFAAGLTRFGRGPVRPAPVGHGGDEHGSDRYDRPVEVVADLPLPVRVGVALIRTWRRHRRTRVR